MRNSGLLDFCAYLENTQLALVIQDSFWIVPVMQTLHILSISALLVSALMINLRVLNIISKSDLISAVVSRYINIIWLALPVLLISGSILIVGEPARSLANPAFQMKMVMLIAVIFMTIGIQRMASTVNDQMQAKGIIKLLAALSVLLWLGIVACGRWIAYT
jgi:cation transport ATPase